MPAVIACIPLITKTYGRSPDGSYCFIYAEDSDVAFIERFALWDGPAVIILLAMVVMVIKVTGRVCLRSKYEPITDGDQFWKALKQLLPLAAFPTLFLTFEIPIFMFHVYAATSSIPNMALEISRGVFFSLWSMTSGGTHLIHIVVVKCLSLAGNRRRENGNGVMQQTNNPTTILVPGSSRSVQSATQFSFPTPSI